MTKTLVEMATELVQAQGNSKSMSIEEFKSLFLKPLETHGLTRRENKIKYCFSLRQPLCAEAITEKPPTYSHDLNP